MDDVDYLVEDNTRVDFAYHRRWMGPKVGWHNDGASWEQITNDDLKEFKEMVYSVSETEITVIEQLGERKAHSD